MKSLFIVRHAKSSWEFSELSDEERPLLEKGRKRTKKIVKFLTGHDTHLDLILSSHAVRAYETARIIAHGLGYPDNKIELRNGIYHADTDELLDQLFGIDDQFKSVMIVGHNPGFTRFANYFLNGEIDWLPTSGVVRIDFDTDKWHEIMDAAYSTGFIVFPGML